MSKPIDGLPVCEFGASFWVGRAIGEPHDAPDQLSIKETVLRVVNSSREDRYRIWLPGCLPHENSYVRVGIRSILACLPGDEVDGEECAGLTAECFPVGIDEAIDIWAVPTVADACSNDDSFVVRKIAVAAAADFQERHLRTRPFKYLLNTFTDFQRVPING